MRMLWEAPPGFEPGIEVLQTFALPLGYGAIMIRAGFEPALPPWKGGVLTPWPTDHELPE